MSLIGKLISLLAFVTYCSGQFRSPEITEHPADILVPRKVPATLNCHAEGRPTPTITWFKNGKLLDIEGKSDHYVLLSNGDLFFLRVLQSKKEDDSGIYWCQASNSVGTVRSKNATLEIAEMKEDFRREPEDTQAAEGDTIILRCVPPRGNPEPVVVWKKNEVEIDPATQHRYKVVDEGSLSIKDVRASDSGLYACTSRNVYATRTSQPAFLKVLVAPHLVSSSGDIVINAGNTAELVCRVGGDPPPEIFWEKISLGNLPADRMTQEENAQVLRISHVAPGDEGIYQCRAENPAGSTSANFSIVVHSRPIIAKMPEDAQISANEVATFQCVISGSPHPTTYWVHENKGVIIEKSQSWEGGRISVDSHNTLTIRNARKEDRGFYVCAAVGIAGSAIARVHLEVQNVLDMPPPVIALGAPNQTLPLGTEADIPCHAVGHPMPKVQWYFRDKIIKENHRISINVFGTLKVTALKSEDTGVYTCKATSKSGTTIWTASLVVAIPTNPNVAFFKMHNEGALPEPPRQVSVESLNATSVKLGWRRGRPGSSPVLGYTVQQWSPDIKGAWTTSTSRPEVSSAMPVSYRVTHLKPDINYVFIVRASNSHGLSRPSEMTHMVKTLSFNEEGKKPLEEIRRRLDEGVLRLHTAEANSSSSLRVKWSLRIDKEYINGIHLRYRSLRAKNSVLNMEIIHIKFISHRDNNFYLIKGLESATKYEVFAAPFYRNIEGKPSAALHATTLHAPPLTSPTGLHYRVLNKTSALITWDELKNPKIKTQIIGYKLLIFNNNSILHANMTVDGSWTLLNNFSSGESYKAVVWGLTESGPGPISSSIVFSLPTGKIISKTNHTSFFPQAKSDKDSYLMILICLVAIFVFIFLLGTVLVIFKKRSENKFPTYIEKEIEGTCSWTEYPKFWNDGTKAQTMKGIQCGDILGPENHFYRQIPTDGADMRIRETKSFDYYDDPATEAKYEDPEGFRLPTFSKQSVPRCISPAPYATSTIVSDKMKTCTSLGQSLPPNIPLEELKNKQISKESVYPNYTMNFDYKAFKEHWIYQPQEDQNVRNDVSSFFIKDDKEENYIKQNQLYLKDSWYGHKSSGSSTRRSESHSKSSTYENEEEGFDYDSFSESSCSSRRNSLCEGRKCARQREEQLENREIDENSPTAEKHETSRNSYLLSMTSPLI